MKLLHTGDLHIGKRVKEYSMLEEQQHILDQILSYVQDEAPDAVILAGDIYDKRVPSAEAVSLFDDFLVRLAKLGKSIFIISGNHDSPERISFASRIMEASRVYLSPVYDGTIHPVVLNDGDTEAAFYMLPFVKPSVVQHYADDNTEIRTYDEAVRYAIQQMDIDKTRRNVLITHQFITGGERTESEDIMVGGLDNIDAAAFDDFDYVALGHLHRPQSCGREAVRYSGSPLKYSISEVQDQKSVTIVEIRGKQEPVISTLPLTPLHDWHDLRGTYDELTAKEYYDNTGMQDAFVRITLTDEEDIPDGMRKLKTIYHRLTELQYDNKRTRAGLTLIGKPMNISSINPMQLFEELFEKQNANKLSQEQNDYLQGLIGQIFNNQ